MFTKTSDLVQFIGLSLGDLAAMLIMIHFLGETHGLVVTVILLIVQLAALSVRITSVQRELINLHHEREEAAQKFIVKS